MGTLVIKDFSSLHNHSHFSLMDGLSLPDEIVKASKDKGLRSIAITDHGACHAHADFYLHGKKHGVRTILGIEAYVIHDLDEWRALKEAADGFEDVQERDSNAKGEDEKNILPVNKQLYRKGHLVLLACNNRGLENLYQLTFKSYRDGFYSKPRMDKKMLLAHADGLVATSACMGGVISNKCWDMSNGRGSFQEIVDEALEFDRIFGRGRFFLELQFNESDSQRFINDCLVKVHEQTGIPLTVAPDAHYTKPEEWKAQELLYMLRSKKTIKTRGDDWSFEVKQLYIKSPEEMWQAFEKFGGTLPPKVVIEAFENTLLIDSLVETFEPDTHKRLPSLPFDNPFKVMGERAIEGLRHHGLADDERYKLRLLHELQVIKEKGFANYFLTTQRIIQEAKKTMLVGEGRGSAAGSLVCYCLGITDLDPVKHDLMFERFMDPARTEEPDIDVDFEDVEETKDMLRRMFGEQNVACLSSYGTFQIKGLLKDLGRVYDIDNRIINDANKKIEKELKVLYLNQDKSTLVVKLDDVQRVSATFNKLVKDYPEMGEHLTKLYGRNRHASRHAAGVIIGDNLPAETALWVQKDKETGKQIVQASFTEGIVNKNVSAMGFTKFDILSIATLKVIHYCLDLISLRTGRPFSELREMIRSKNMKLDDPRVMKHVFANGHFAGIFQFTERGIRKLSQNVKPDTFEDVSAIASIYRPGPLAGGFDKLYARNKHHPEMVEYEHPLLESILKPTRGCIVFQEQLMQICNVLGKMSWKDVNAVRKVLLKKDKSKSEEFLKAENERLTSLFLKGCEENGFAKEKAEKLWKDLLAFGGYGFNKAHSHTYSVMTMQCAYLATYYPMEWYAAVLTKGQSGELQQYVSDIKLTGIDILPVDINSSGAAHSIEGNTIRLAFSSVKGVGPSAIEKIVSHQPYTDFVDFLDRSGATKTAIIPLIKAGAFESICALPMAQLMDRYLTYANNAKLKTKKHREEWLTIWNSPWEKKSVKVTVLVPGKEGKEEEQEIDMDLVDGDYPLHFKVSLENQLFGFSLRGSPFEILDRQEKIDVAFGGAENVTDYEWFIESNEELAVLPVMVNRIFEKPQRNGQMMCFLGFETKLGTTFSAPCFSSVWKHIKPVVSLGKVYLGTFNRKLEDPEDLVVGKTGFGHSAASAAGYMIDVDSIDLAKLKEA